MRTIHPDGDPSRPRPLDWQTYADHVLCAWHELLAGHPTENAVQEFLELHPAMVPGGSGDVGPGGHHGSEMSAVFSRPTLKGAGRSYEPDFMWITRSSGLVTPILVEIEDPSKRWFNKDGRPTAKFTAAHDQLNDWRSWFQREGNAAIFRKEFIFGEHYGNRPLRPQFVLVYGRHHEFEFGGGHVDPGALRFKRDGLRRTDDEVFLTFDSLRPRYDHGDSLTLRMTATGPVVHAFSPTYATGTHTGSVATRLGSPSDALRRSVMLTRERKDYLESRWRHWGEEHTQRTEAGTRGSVIRALGRE